MTEQYWLQRWQSDDIPFNQLQPNALLLRYIDELNLKPGACVFVPLCGKSIDMQWLVSQKYNVIGVELSPIACADFFKENDLPVSVTKTDQFSVFKSENITLYSGDFFALNKDAIGHIDAVFDRAALIALPIELRQLYVKHLVKLLEKDTQILLVTTSYNQNEMAGPPFSVDKEEAGKLYGNYFNVKQLYNKSVTLVDAHLRDKGLTQLCEQAYHMTSINNRYPT